ncbi:hypothetical protein WJX72_008737 [[Myrmecia] bisecta]|uniref:Glycoside hydrolase family 5 domain-containing protein n=1 Tax=[Myrmecia] bisecta TaxID=41462 RepID=A0AAW1PHL7_9CHLO
MQHRVALGLAGLAALLLVTLPACQGLTTSSGKIVDASGNELILKGVALSGFEISHTMSGDPSKGTDSQNKDWPTNMYRLKMMGFNMVRLEWSQQGFLIDPVNYAHPSCKVASKADIQAALTPPGVTTSHTLPLAPPTIAGGVCSKDLPNTSTFDRFVWMVNYLAGQGFYINVCYHSYGFSLGGDTSIATPSSWVSNWVTLLKAIKAYGPATNGRLILDIVNEPDVYGGAWDNPAGNLPWSLSDYYTKTMDALNPLCTDCLFFIQGIGQYAGAPFVNWGDGFSRTNPASSPANFFTTALKKPYADRIVLAPHIYCPTVSGQDLSLASGPHLFARLTESFGTLNKQGFCDASGKNCHIFAVVLGEFNANFKLAADMECFNSIKSYLSNTGPGQDKQHNPITSFVDWAWDADADTQYGNGGIVASDWQGINWDKINALSELGLVPWYAKGFQVVTAPSAAKTKGAVTTQSIDNTNGTVTPATPQLAVARAVLNVSGPGVLPFGAENQAMLLKAINMSLYTPDMAAGNRRLLAALPLMPLQNGTVVSMADVPSQNTSIVTMRLSALTAEPAVFVTVLSEAITNGFVTNAIRANNLQWSVDLAAGSAVVDETPAPAPAGSTARPATLVNNTCKTKFASSCLDGTSLTPAKVYGIIFGVIGGLALIAAVAGGVLFASHKRRLKRRDVAATANPAFVEVTKEGVASPKHARIVASSAPPLSPA